MLESASRYRVTIIIQIDYDTNCTDLSNVECKCDERHRFIPSIRTCRTGKSGTVSADVRLRECLLSKLPTFTSQATPNPNYISRAEV